MPEFDVFLTHDWGVDEMGRDNHARVVSIANRLRDAGLRVWIDETEMTGDIMQKMCDGIENSSVIVVFITRRYVEKVSS